MSTDFDWNWYWGVDFVGLDERGAERLASIAGDLDGVLGATVLDPRDWFTVNMDRDTAEALWRQLASSEARGAGSSSLRDEIREWLDAVSDSPTSTSDDRNQVD